MTKNSKIYFQHNLSNVKRSDLDEAIGSSSFDVESKVINNKHFVTKISHRLSEDYTQYTLANQKAPSLTFNQQ